MWTRGSDGKNEMALQSSVRLFVAFSERVLRHCTEVSPQEVCKLSVCFEADLHNANKQIIAGGHGLSVVVDPAVLDTVRVGGPPVTDMVFDSMSLAPCNFDGVAPKCSNSCMQAC